MNERSKTTLETLIEAGVLHEGERLYASKTFTDLGAVSADSDRGQIVAQFEAELIGGDRVRVVSDGFDGTLDGREYPSTSAAISACFRRVDTGWLNWKVERDGEKVTLSQIRNEFDLLQRKPALESLDQPVPEAGLSAVTPAATEISRDFRS